MLNSEQLGPEEFRFGTSTDQWRHKAAVPKEGTVANSTALEVFGLQASGLDFLLSDRAPPLIDQERRGGPGLIGPCCSCGEISEGSEELFHLLLEEDVSFLCILMGPLGVSESNLQHLTLFLLLVQLLLKLVYLGLVLRTGLLQTKRENNKRVNNLDFLKTILDRKQYKRWFLLANAGLVARPLFL